MKAIKAYVEIVLMGLGLLWLFTTYVHASGPQRVVFNQAEDCSLITKWELAYEKANVAGITPRPTATVEAFNNTAPLVCGNGTMTIQPVFGSGLMRYWLRAVDADGTPSAWSNFVENRVNLTAPALSSVGG